jgi:uncharacterized protein YfaS (alpha-2-macroglobulin family)
VQAGPLRVTRHQPEGAVTLAPYVTVTFSAPMVPVTSHDDLAKFPVPIRITPEPPGKWRWVGTQTAMFQPEKRFPMATDFTVDIDAGARSVGGAALGQAQHYAFSTPPPSLLEYGPTGNSVRLDPAIYLRFDQAMDPQIVLAKIQATAGTKTPALRLATQDEIDADPELSRLAERRDSDESSSHDAKGPTVNVMGGRIVALKPVDPLQTDTLVSVQLPAGTPSTEGPRTTKAARNFSFHTYGPMQVVEANCRECNPFSTFDLLFSNEIDQGKFDKAAVTVTPPIPGMKVTASGRWLSVHGRKKGKTKYQVTIAKTLTDEFGQTLGEDATRTFDVGRAPSRFFSEDRAMIVLDPAASARLSVFSVNDPTLHVRLFAVKPGDYRTYTKWREDWDYNGKTTAPPGKLVFDRVIHPERKPDELVETQVDLDPALSKEKVGQVLAVVETTRPFKDRWDKEWVREWIQVTHLGLRAVADSSDLVAWTTALGNGAPVQGVSVYCGSAAGTSGADGLARLTNRADAVIASKDGDTTFLPDALSVWDYHPDRTRFFTFDDRKTYKPGEEVHIKGWVRDIDYGKGSDVALVPGSDGLTLRWAAQDPRGAEIGKGETRVDALGGFDFALTTPKNANLGTASVSLVIPGHGTGQHFFEIQEFRRPEFEVSASAGAGPFIVGEQGIATVDAKYYAGGGLPNAGVEWTVTRTNGSFTPPNREDFLFGKNEWDEWWRRPSRKPDRTTETWNARTDSQGSHRLRVDFDALEPAYPMSLSLSATVTDVNRQAWGASTTMLVHPADVYVGMKLERPFLNAGETMQIDTLAVDLEGHAVAARPIAVTAARLDWDQTGSGFEQKEVDEQSCSLTSGDAPVRCSLVAKKGGQYRLRAVVTDEFGRKSQTVTRVWVMDRDMPADRSVAEDAVKIIPDKKEYAAGESAKLLLVAPFAPAEGLLVLAREGLLSAERFTLSSTTQMLTVKADGKLTPNVHAIVLLTGAAARRNEAGVADPTLPKRPAYARGDYDLPITRAHRSLSLTVSPRDKALEPGGQTTVDVDVKDPHGAPVADAEVAIVVVDESILALSSYKLPDPKGTFYPSREARVTDATTLTSVVLPRPGEMTAESRDLMLKTGDDGGGEKGNYARASKKMVMAEVSTPAATAAPAPPPPPAEQPPGAPGSPRTPIAVRTNFNPLAVFAPAKRSDGKGHVEVPVKLPDSVTRYRVMAVAASGESSFGSEESTITARLPLMVRPSAPRFLNFGDRFELPVVVQNQTDKPIDVSLAVRSSNAIVSEAPGKRVTVPASDRVEVRFLAAADRPGTARFQIGAAAGNFADASDVELPVWTPATTEAFATYGVIDNGAIAQPVKFPSGVVQQFGGLEITTSSTAMQGLTDAVVYLVHYPYECNEQLASRILAVASLRDVLSAFKSKDLPPPAALEASVKADLDKLKTRQKWDGGWAFWWGEAWPFVSIHVAHALARAEAKGYALDAYMRQRALSWLRSVEGHIPGWYGPEARRALVAYALYARRLLKDPDPARARRLVTEYGGVDHMDLEAVGWIWPTLSEDKGSKKENLAIRTFVGNRVTETAGAAHFVTSYGDSDYLLLHSDRRADGVLLEALMVDQPESDLVPKLVKGLLGHRTAGRWGSTQENAFVLLALDGYFDKYEKPTPDFVARAWLGDKYAGDHTFRGRSTDYSKIDVPMRFLADMKGGDLTLAKEGTGRLYFRIGMQYAPEDLRPPPADQGFTVSRSYEAVEDPGDVRKDASGVWHFKAGKKVRARVTMVAPARRYHVALVDPIPAGIEPMNPALAVTGTIPQSPDDQKNADPYWYWHSTWYEHQNMRDERVEAFAPLVWDGVHEYVYTARATTPGNFVVPPPKAEEMYSPEVFGRGSGDRVVVE